MHLCDLVPGVASMVEVTDLVSDSRRVSPGALFFALPGARVDGNDFVPQAMALGAVAVVSELPCPTGFDAAWVQVPDAQEAVWQIAHRFYGDPSSQLRLLGVTGTNGKTTATHLIRAILQEAGSRCALIGTLGANICGEYIDLGHTTPMAHDLARMMRQAVKAGCDSLVMEVSSHALALHRADGCKFDASTYTNLTPEHLDFHQNMDDYFAAKARLFSEFGGNKDFVGVINLDDLYGPRMATEVRGRLVTFGLNEGDIRCSNVKVTATRIEMRLLTPAGDVDVSLPLGGRFNVQNALAAAATCHSLGLTPSQIAAGLAKSLPAPGRFEGVSTNKGFHVIVDYAHSPDALEKLLEACRDLHPDRLTVVFGCGGDRDATKRPKMGAIAARLADRVVITSDNPRTEDPQKIIDSILTGVAPSAMAAVEVEPDRRQAISRAISGARAGDLVVVAGKGHEDYQITGDTRIHFDDREVVREALL